MIVYYDYATTRGLVASATASSISGNDNLQGPHPRIPQAKEGWSPWLLTSTVAVAVGEHHGVLAIVWTWMCHRTEPTAEEGKKS